MQSAVRVDRRPRRSLSSLEARAHRELVEHVLLGGIVFDEKWKTDGILPYLHWFHLGVQPSLRLQFSMQDRSISAVDNHEQRRWRGVVHDGTMRGTPFKFPTPARTDVVPRPPHSSVTNPSFAPRKFVCVAVHGTRGQCSRYAVVQQHGGNVR